MLRNLGLGVEEKRCRMLQRLGFKAEGRKCHVLRGVTCWIGVEKIPHGTCVTCDGIPGLWWRRNGVTCYMVLG